MPCLPTLVALREHRNSLCERNLEAASLLDARFPGRLPWLDDLAKILSLASTQGIWWLNVVSRCSLNISGCRGHVSPPFVMLMNGTTGKFCGTLYTRQGH